MENISEQVFSECFEILQQKGVNTMAMPYSQIEAIVEAMVEFSNKNVTLSNK